MIVHSANEMGCSHIMSEDLIDGQKHDNTLVLNPLRSVADN